MASSLEIAFSNHTASSYAIGAELLKTISVSAPLTTVAVKTTNNNIELVDGGLPGPIYTAIHVVALCSLSITVFISSSLLVYLCVTLTRGRRHRSRQTRGREDDVINKQRPIAAVKDNLQEADDKVIDRSSAGTIKTGTETGASNSRHQQMSTPGSETGREKAVETRSFWSWNVGERMVVYLATSDLLFGTSHILDHSYMLATRFSPPDRICAPMAYVLLSAIFSQWSVVIFSAVSACSLIVFGKKLPVGRYDWRLLFGTFGLGVTFAGVIWGINGLGPSGEWCLFDMRTPVGRMTMNVMGVFQICTFGIVIISYAAIWIKIQRTARLMTTGKENRYGNSARVMMIFVAVFILQLVKTGISAVCSEYFVKWWPLICFTIWSLVGTPDGVILIITVLVVNLGGLYNCIAYTIIRRRLQKQNASRGQQGVVFNKANNSVRATSTTSTSTIPRDLTTTVMTNSR